MAIQAIDHLYVETQSFGDSRAFWEGLGFELVEEWGDPPHRSGRLKCGDAVIVLAQGDHPGVTVHFRVDQAEQLSVKVVASPSVKVSLPLEPTHWGTRWMRVEDPEGRVFALEEPSSQ